MASRVLHLKASILRIYYKSMHQAKVLHICLGIQPVSEAEEVNLNRISALSPLLSAALYAQDKT